MPANNSDQPDVQRHRTAIRRNEPSLPLKCLLRDGFLNASASLFDYGCGHGDDLHHLSRLGFECEGWDPVHRPDVAPRDADIVNLGFVLNVIEDVQERTEVLSAAWQLSRRLLVVAARIAVGENVSPQVEYADGVLTRLQTFQKYYAQSELRSYLEQTLGSEAFPAAPGVFYVFKDDGLREQYFAARYRHRGAAPRKRISEKRFEEHRVLLEPLIAKATELARLPFPDELQESLAIMEVFGSLKRAFALIRRVTGAEAWDALRQDRVNDLTVYLALARFRKRPPISSLPTRLQRDIRDFFGSYKKACERADSLLFTAGDHEAIDQACQRSSLGRLTSNALLVHKSAMAGLEPVLRVYESCARAYLGEIDDANIVKLHRFSGKVSYLACPEFDKLPHPTIQRTVKLAMRSLHLDCFDHSVAEDPIVLDRKELFVDQDYPWREKFCRLTQQEEAYDLLNGVTDLLSRETWDARLDNVGLRLRGHRLIWKPDVAPKRKRAARLAASKKAATAEPAVVVSDKAVSPEPTRRRRAGPCSESGKDSLLERSKRFGVGKEIGDAVYVHRQYEEFLGSTVAWAKRWLPDDFPYHVVKYNQRTLNVSFIRCSGFDSEPEPAVEAVLVVSADGSTQRRPLPDDPYIYHHKWLFVADDYSGFDLQESKRRSSAWMSLPDVDKSRIGRRSYWETHVVPRLAE